MFPISDDGTVITKRYKDFLNNRKIQEQQKRRQQQRSRAGGNNNPSAEEGGRDGEKMNGSKTTATSSRKEEDCKSQKMIMVPYNCDVLFGCGKGGYFNDVGNSRYRSMIEDLKVKYEKSGRDLKSKMIEEVIKVVHEAGGLFLKKSGEKETGSGSSCWVVVDEAMAIEKAGHSFRALRSSSSSSSSSTTTSGIDESPHSSSVRHRSNEESSYPIDTKKRTTNRPENGVSVRTQQQEASNIYALLATTPSTTFLLGPPNAGQMDRGTWWNPHIYPQP